LFAKGGENLKALTKSPFLAIKAKGGESISPKQKDRTTTYFLNCVLKIILVYLKLVSFKIGTPLMRVSQFVYPKTLLKAKRRILFRGSFV
jgi:hypothetical protein